MVGLSACIKANDKNTNRQFQNLIGRSMTIPRYQFKLRFSPQFSPENFNLPVWFYRISSFQMPREPFNRESDAPIGRNIHILPIKVPATIPKLYYADVKSPLSITTIITNQFPDNSVSNRPSPLTHLVTTTVI